MSSFDDDPEDRLLGRLHEATGSDAALRRLRRRYDQLREDYEGLLDRLGDLEERAEAGEEGGPEGGASFPAPAARDWLSEVMPQLLAPLAHLREQYEAAVQGLQQVVDGLSGLAAGAMKGQHGPGRIRQPEEARQAGRPRHFQVEVKGKGFGELLDFQERISGIEGVARVSIHGIDSERATFIVELDD